MPWKECSVMDGRVEFVARRLAGEPMADLCRECGISRKTECMRAPQIVEEGHYLPHHFVSDNPEGLEVARRVTLLAITRNAANLGKDTLAEAFER